MSKIKSRAAVFLIIILSLTLLGGFLLDLPAKVKAANKMIGGTPLPDQVPYLNSREDFFIGNGMAGGGGVGDGKWNFLVGPDYTCPNYLGSEEIKLVVDGLEQSVTMNVYRARNTGIFYGVKTIGDLEVYLIDHAYRGDPWTARLVMIDNKSATTSHNVSVKAYVTTLTGSGRTGWVAKDSGNRDSGIVLKLDTSLKCVQNWVCQNWANRYAMITFNEPATTATYSGGAYILDTGTKTIPGGSSYNTALYHYMHYDDKTDSEYINLIRARNITDDAANCITQWQNWFNGVGVAYSLSKINDQRARDIVEGGLAIIKMNQSRDGGIVANERGWNMSYVRDAYCGLRGLGANGHFDELKSFIQWQDHKYAAHGFIPNACSCGSDAYAHPNGNTGGPCPESNAAVEVTALYLLMARDYYQATGDLQTLTNADSSLKYAMDIQLKHAVANGYKLEFSGDETELCNAVNVSATGFNRDLSRYWSMTSIALCSASLDFYIQYLTAKGANPASYLNSQDNRTLNLNNELNNLKDALETNYWRTDLPECPNGFHDWFRVKSDNSWPSGRIVNFTLFPLYYGTPLKYPDRAGKDVTAMKQYFNDTTKFLPLVPTVGDGRFLGHDLGYLLWGLVAVGDSKKAEVYDALVNGVTTRCWGTYNEAYNADGSPNANGLRTFETGVNISAIAKYWGVGGGPTPEPTATPTPIPPGTWVRIDDYDGAITYSGNWSYNNTTPGYYQNTCHYSNVTGDYAQYTFTGTGIRWIGAKNNDHAEADIYLDGVWQISINTYNSSWLKQQVLYEKTGLANGSHTIKIAVKTSGCQDVDAFEYCTGGTTTAPTATPSPTPTLTPTSTPTPVPPGGWSRIDDNAGAITYSGSWTYSTTTVGYYQNTCHYSSTIGNYAQYTFNGTGIRWIGGKNNDHEEADLYLDGVWQTSINTYSSSWLMQQILYEKTGLTNGSHTIKITVKTSGNQDVDAFEYYTGGGTSTPTSTPTPTPGHTDEFGSGTLDTAWSWIREDSANWSLTARSGYLRINTQGQDLWGSGGNTENILLRNPVTGDWTISTRLEFNPASNYQQAGLIVYQNDDNYLKCVYGYDSAVSGGKILEYCKEISATPTNGKVAITANPVYLKITKSGTTYTLSYSTDNNNWNQAQQYTSVSFSSLKVGLIAQGAAGVSADFDWFDLK